MSRVKQIRKDRFHALPNCVAQPENLLGKWHEWFQNPNPIVIEPGCGKAELSIGMATQFPEKNFIAIDLKSDRLCRGADLALEAQLKNIAFLRMHAAQLDETFAQHSVDAIWLTFPDPFPKDRHEKHRLTHPSYLSLYQKILKPGGRVHFKTDNDALMQWTMQILNALHITPVLYTDDLHNSLFKETEAAILTSFEKKFLNRNKNIHYICFEIPNNLVFFNPEIHSILKNDVKSNT
jgi:tRNA (guanine-N7-)-methyltransferase